MEVREGRDIESRLGNNPDLDVGQWTVAGDTLFHAAAKTRNVVAIEQLIVKVYLAVPWFGQIFRLLSK